MLTDSLVRSAKRSDRPRKLSDGGGLHLLVVQNGRHYWRYSYRFDGKQKTLALGVYPDVGLAKARERHREASRLLVDGIDPAAEKRALGKTFEVIAREWHDHWKAARHERHAHYVLKRLEADVFPEIGSLPLAEIPTSAFRNAVQKIEKRGAVDVAKRVLQTCSQIMRYAVANDLTMCNPVADVKPGDVLKRHKRRNFPRIDAKDLPKLLHAIDSYVGAEHTRLALQLMSLTFVRTSEVIGGRWSEFDKKAAHWNIPAERMKMKTPHIVPLSKQSLELLEKLEKISFDRELVFPGDVNPAKPMSNNTILFALYRMGYRGRMTGHGFRGVASTILHEQGWPHEHIELQLAHQERDDTSAAYNHALHLTPRAEMMQTWADHLDALRREKQEQPQERAA
ncbi:MAG TPA: integrase arm-type DNA-binding domain-containing protein [Steroidobacteraceae bacterium]|jgi:integrase